MFLEKKGPIEKDLLSTDQLRLEVEKKFIEHIKLCQDNFLYFVQEVWPDFICRKEKDPNKWGTIKSWLKSLLVYLIRKRKAYCEYATEP
jgi:hypothetical protein